VALGALTADWDQTGAYDIILDNQGSQLKILEAGATPTLYGIFTVTDLTSADKTYTFPNFSGTVITTGNLTDITAIGNIPTLTLEGGTYDTSLIAGTPAASVTYTLPANTGSTGQYLKLGASNVLSWDTPAGAGDITAIGDVATGAAFTSDGTAGTSLYFYDTDGRGQLTLANLAQAATWYLPNASGTIITTGNLTSITTTGTIGTGTWQGSVVGGTYGGTGVNNGASTITIGGNVTFTGGFTTAITVTGNTTVTFPTSGTLSTLALIAAGSNGTEAANAGDNTTAARSDHEHYIYRDLVWFYAGAIATGDPAIYIRLDEAGAAGDILSAYAILGTPGTSTSTIDILTCTQANIDGTPSWTTIFTNKLLFDANEKSTNTASTAASLNVTQWAANDHFRINVDTAGTDAANLTVKLKVRVKTKAS
jgi:hypothetical protein